MAQAGFGTANPLDSLNREFMRLHPIEAARALESFAPENTAKLLQALPVGVIAGVIEKLNPALAEQVLQHLPSKKLGKLLEVLSIRTCVAILGRLTQEEMGGILTATSDSIRKELKGLLDYPNESAGRMMNPRVAVVNEAASVEAVLSQMQQGALPKSRVLFLVNNDLQLVAQLRSFDLMFADRDAGVKSLSKPVTQFIQDFDSREDVFRALESTKAESLPVLNADYQVVGVIEGLGLLDALKEDIGLDMQTMVGASKEERALSSAWFAVRKRLPWLQINLVTAFLAAAVVGMFEATIAQFTALAVLMPIAAGQSGNTGAQALAVTMRGLTLREVGLRDWFRVARKEFASGLINGIGVATVCGLGVWLWSQSSGLALVMALAMIISMTIAGLSGAVVPMILKRFGLDPAQSSSIVLTTITDIAGFVSFLGIATLFSAML